MRKPLAIVTAMVLSSLGCSAGGPPAQQPAEGRWTSTQASQPTAESAPSATPRSVAPPEARELVFLLTTSGDQSLAQRSSERIFVALGKAGYRVERERGVPHDARLELRYDDASGESAQKLSLVLTRDDKVVDWLAMPLTTSGEADDASLFELVDRLSESPRLLSLAGEAAKARSERRREATGAKALAGPSTATQAAPAVVAESAIRRCRNARSADACDEVRSYLEQHPDGPSAAQAKSTLALSETRIARLKQQLGG